MSNISYAPPGPYTIKKPKPVKPVPTLREALTEEMLMGLCDMSQDFGRYGTLQYMIQDALHTQALNSPLSKTIGGRLILNDRWPVFGKDGTSYTKKPVGYNDPRKRVTVPAFDIAACPAVPVKYFKDHDLEGLRRIFQESLQAMGKAELQYFHSLLEAVTVHSSVYPSINAKGAVTPNVVFDAIAIMERDGSTRATAILFDYECDCMVDEGGTLGRLPVIGFPPYDNKSARGAAYIFGQPKDPKLCNAMLIDNGFKFRIKHEYGPVWEWKSPVELKQVENVGFLVGSSSTIKISPNGEVPVREPEKPGRVAAFIIGEEGGDIVRVYK